MVWPVMTPMNIDACKACDASTDASTPPKYPNLALIFITIEIVSKTAEH